MSAIILLFLSTFAMAETQNFEIKLGIQHCQKSDGTQTCEGTTYKTYKETLDLEGNNPWQKEFGEFFVNVIIKKREPKYIVQINLYSAHDGQSLASYATDVDSPKELNAIKLGSAEVKKAEDKLERAWVILSVVR